MKSSGTLEITIGPGGPVEWGLPLPPKFRPESSERCIEVPLALSVAVWCPLVLDAGAALNIKNVHASLPSTLMHVTLGSEKHYAHSRRQYARADLRALPFTDRAFPGVLCVSTLEHIGMDNRHYGHAGQSEPDSVWDAVRELRRVCGGVILLSVPFGRAEVHPSGRWRAFGSEDIDQIAAILTPASIRVACYALELDGWRMADPTIGDRRAWRDDKTVTGLAVVRAILRA